ncbi:MAG TPA: lipocalin-like domain-containing protein [Bacteroidales bacterium]
MKSSLLEQIEGSWLLVSMTYTDAKGKIVNLYGESPMGILTYDKCGYMNAQMGYCHRSNFKNSSLGEGSADEITAAYKTYMAYYGKYYEKEPGTIIHQVEGCLFPNWQGKEEIRYAKIEDGLLVITTPPTLFGDGEIIIKAVWKKP